MTDWSRVCCSRAATAAASPPWRAPTSSRIGPPISTLRSRTPAYTIFFDAAATQGRVAALDKAIAAGKHIHCEKPGAPTAAQGLALLQEARGRGVKHGVVEDKVHLPGLQKLAALARGGELGRIVGFRLEFGWWVFDGSEQPC